MAEDYYKILGITKTASPGEIKKAYRKLAIKYHPDKTKGDKALEDKFKKISEAYAVLSDSEKKNQYDTYGSADFQQRFSQEDIFRNFDIGDILKDFGFGGGGGGFSSFGRGGRTRGGGFSSMGGNPFSQNMGGAGFGGSRQQPQAKGKDLEYEIPLTLDEIINGTKKTISINQAGSATAIEVKIPKGLTKDKKIRLAGKGEASPYGGPAGNLYIRSNPIVAQGISIEGNDILISQNIKLSKALLGGKIEVATPTGKTINLNIPAGTRHKSKLRIANHGIPHMKGGKDGDLFVIIHIDMPKKLTDDQKDLIHQLEKTGL